MRPNTFLTSDARPGRLIILRGPMGVGKSSVADELAKRVGARVIRLDDELAARGLDVVKPDEPCIPVRSFLDVQLELKPDLDWRLGNGETVIVEGNVYYEEQLDFFDERVNTPATVITLTAPLDVCIERERQRPTSLGAESVRAVYGLVQRVRPDHVVDTVGKSVADVVDDILALLDQTQRT